MEGGSTRGSSSLSKQDTRQDKVIHMMRHGQTEMNVFLQFNEQARMGLLDPKMYDTKLTYRGRRQAEMAVKQVQKLDPAPEVLVVSPLTRALCTAELAFGSVACPRVVQPLARERLYYSSDVGQLPADLQRQWPMYDFSHLPPIWWYSDGSNDPTVAIPEPNEDFLLRVYELYQWLLNQPQHSIAMVAHHAVLKALTGIDFENCQMISMNLSDFPIEAYMHQLRRALKVQQQQQQQQQLQQHSMSSPVRSMSYQSMQPERNSTPTDEMYETYETYEVSLAGDVPTATGQPLANGNSAYLSSMSMSLPMDKAYIEESTYYQPPPQTLGHSPPVYEYEGYWMQTQQQQQQQQQQQHAGGGMGIAQPRFYSQGALARGMATPPQLQDPFRFGYSAGIVSDSHVPQYGYVQEGYNPAWPGGLSRHHHQHAFSGRQHSSTQIGVGVGNMSRQSSTTSFMGF